MDPFLRAFHFSFTARTHTENLRQKTSGRVLYFETYQHFNFIKIERALYQCAITIFPRTVHFFINNLLGPLNLRNFCW